ncbi:antitoxin [Janibacter anophelis]|uniref:antitoxin n=1 Tax=Janibacter anophelis TaxID=319054 RepID=UPI000834B943|nr:antitoxin [Janibacter anophelis]
MAKFTKAAAMFTAAETARQWARKNPQQASDYIDKATGFVDKRTHGKYHDRIAGLSRSVKKNLTGHDTVDGAPLSGQAPPPPSGPKKPFPDLRA